MCGQRDAGEPPAPSTALIAFGAVTLSTRAARSTKLWYDSEGDYLEVMFEQKEGYCRETSSDQVMEKVDAEGNVIGFSVLRVSALRERPLDVTL